MSEDLEIKFVPVTKLAASMGISPAMQLKELQRGKFPIRKIGDRNYISLQTLSNYLNPFRFCSYACKQIFDDLSQIAIRQ